MKRPTRWLLLAALSVAGCQVAPPYERPAAPMARDWQLEAPWREATPRDAQLKDDWWRTFDDPVLTWLVEQALARSATLQGAAARVQQARSLVDLNTAGLMPTVQLGGGPSRQRISSDRPLTNYSTTTTSTVQNDLRLGFTVNYELDLFGRVRSLVAGARASLQQTEADYQNTRLLLTTDVAGNYFNLRALDSDIDVLEQGIDLQRRALDLARNRYELGASSGLELAQQEATLASTRTQHALQQRMRRQYETALATLTGTPAPDFSVAPRVQRDAPPMIPIGLPSDLLERRPDIAAAERAMAAANAQIGIARAAFYPSLSLTGALGFESTRLSDLVSASTIFWSLGASVAQRVFDGGRAQAGVDASRAAYDATVASYRQTVLTALQEVENGVTGLSALERAARTARAAVDSSERALTLANDRYAGGLTNYLDVITAQQALLNNQRQAAQILGQRQITSVYLIKALGGGWHAPRNAG